MDLLSITVYKAAVLGMAGKQKKGCIELCNTILIPKRNTESDMKLELAGTVNWNIYK